MRIDFPYPGIAPLEVPQANLVGVFRPQVVPAAPPVAEQVAAALRAPIASPPLGELVGPRTSVLILVDDYTRPTPVAEMLPPLIAELAAAGVPASGIKLLVASGTHRLMTGEELAARLGPQILRTYQVFQHRWQDPHDLAPAGETSGGLPIVVNRRLLEAGLVLGLGRIVPHRVAGFSGGAKIVNPGAFGHTSGRQEIHWLSAQVPARAILGVADNYVRRAIDEAGARVGLRFIVNVVQDDAGKVAGVFAGDPVAAHRRGVGLCRDLYGLPLAELADVVVVDSYSADASFCHAARAAWAGELAVRPGGALVLVTPCPEGVGRHHPAVLEFGVRSRRELERLTERGEIDDVVAAAILMLTAWVVRERASGIMVCPGIAPQDQYRLGFTPARTPQDALELAFQRLGRDARVAVFHHGAEILPLVPQEFEMQASAAATGAAPAA